MHADVLFLIAIFDDFYIFSTPSVASQFSCSNSYFLLHMICSLFIVYLAGSWKHYCGIVSKTGEELAV